MDKDKRYKHHFLESAPEIPTQEPKSRVKRVLPRDVVRKMMLAETAASPTSPRIRCERCGDYLIQKFIIRIQGVWIHPDMDVCRLCYRSKTDIPVSNAYKRMRSKRSC